jgi:hypothetical protein
MRIQDQLIRIVYAYHASYDIGRFYLNLNSNSYMIRIYKIIKIIELKILKIFQIIFFSLNKHICEPI